MCIYSISLYIYFILLYYVCINKSYSLIHPSMLFSMNSTNKHRINPQLCVSPMKSKLHAPSGTLASNIVVTGRFIAVSPHVDEKKVISIGQIIEGVPLDCFMGSLGNRLEADANGMCLCAC